MLPDKSAEISVYCMNALAPYWEKRPASCAGVGYLERKEGWMRVGRPGAECKRASGSA